MLLVCVHAEGRLHMANSKIGTPQQDLAVAEKELKQLEAALTSLPAGSAYISNCGGRTRLRGTIKGKDHFFNQNDMALAKKLLLKGYLQKQREELIRKIQWLKVAIDYKENWLGLSARPLSQHPELGSYLAEELQSFSSLSADLLKWTNAPDSCSAPHQDNRTEPAVSGCKVRSKSEVMIASVLYERGLPFRYEEPLHLRGRVFFPDFTLRSPESGRFYWYEHFGMMDDPGYARKAWNKLAFYSENGLLPSVNLIVTFETREHKLNILKIHQALNTVIESLN